MLLLLLRWWLGRLLLLLLRWWLGRLLLLLLLRWWLGRLLLLLALWQRLGRPLLLGRLPSWLHCRDAQRLLLHACTRLGSSAAAADLPAGPAGQVQAVISCIVKTVAAQHIWLLLPAAAAAASHCGCCSAWLRLRR